MPTSNPRMGITVKPETKKIFEDAAEIMGIPASRLVTQVLEEAQVSIKQIGEAMLAAKIDPVKGLKKMNEIVQEGRQAAAEGQLDIEDQIAIKKRAEKASKAK